STTVSVRSPHSSYSSTRGTSGYPGTDSRGSARSAAASVRTSARVASFQPIFAYPAGRPSGSNNCSVGLWLGSGGRTPNAPDKGRPSFADKYAVNTSSAGSASFGTETVNTGNGAHSTSPARAATPSTARAALTRGGRKALYASTDAAVTRRRPSGSRKRARSTEGTTAYRAITRPGTLTRPPVLMSKRTRRSGKTARVTQPSPSRRSRGSAGRGLAVTRTTLPSRS